MSDGWEWLASVPSAVLEHRQRQLFSREAKQERRYADAHWTLHQRSTSGWTLGNTGSDTAHDLALDVRIGAVRPTFSRRGAAFVLLNLFGLRRWSERFEPAMPPPTTHPVATDNRDPVTPGHSIELTFDRPSDTAWLEVEWQSPDNNSHWAKYPLPVDQTSPAPGT